jgi:hypothetical protein
LKNKKPVYQSKSAIYISVDIECSGPIPVDYSMLSLGACVVGKEYDDKNSIFYVEIQPISGNYIKEALDICGLSLEELRVKGTPPQKAMEKFVNWISKASNTRKPIFVAYPVTVH